MPGMRPLKMSSLGSIEKPKPSRVLAATVSLSPRISARDIVGKSKSCALMRLRLAVMVLSRVLPCRLRPSNSRAPGTADVLGHRGRRVTLERGEHDADLVAAPPADDRV